MNIALENKKGENKCFLLVIDTKFIN